MKYDGEQYAEQTERAKHAEQFCPRHNPEIDSILHGPTRTVFEFEQRFVATKFSVRRPDRCHERLLIRLDTTPARIRINGSDLLSSSIIDVNFSGWSKSAIADIFYAKIKCRFIPAKKILIRNKGVERETFMHIVEYFNVDRNIFVPDKNFFSGNEATF